MLFAKLRKASVSFIISVRLSAWNKSVPPGRSSFKLYVWLFTENLSRKFEYHWNRTRIVGTLHETQYMFLIIFRLILPTGVLISP